MNIVVDHQPYCLQDSTAHTIQQLADEVCADCAGDGGRLVVALACDGQSIQPEQLESVLSQSLDSFKSIELETVLIRRQVAIVLGQALEVLESSAGLREQVADDLTQGRHQAAMAGLQKLLEIFKQAQQTTFLSSQLLGIELDAISVDGRHLAQVLETIKDNLNELKSGMENQDYVLVADILRYQFAEPLDAWQAILSNIRSSIPPA